MEKVLFLCALMLPVWVGAQDCTMEQYRKLLREADQAVEQGQYDLAVNKLQSAKVCRPEKEGEVNEKMLRVFKVVNKQRELAVANEAEAKRQKDSAGYQRNIAIVERDKAEKRAMEILVYDLAYKSTTALNFGDRTTAIRLADFAYQYLEAENPKVGRAFFEALYYNDNPEHKPLPLASNIEGHTSRVRSVAFSPDGKWLATGSNDKTARIWDISNGKASLVLKGHEDRIWSVAFSPDGKWLATASEDKTAKIWDLESGQAIKTLSGHLSRIYSVAFSPDSKWLATGSDDNTAKIWDLSHGTLIYTLEGHYNAVWSVAFSPQGGQIATGSANNTAKIWDLNTGKEILTLKGHTNNVLSVAFSPDGKRLATGSWDKTAIIWDVNSGNQQITLKGHNGFISSLAFSPDGKRLATGSHDMTAKIWNLDDSTQIFNLTGHSGWISGVAYSPDGTKLATASFDNSAKIWHLSVGKGALTVKTHSLSLESIVVSPDGKFLATGGNIFGPEIWDIDSGDRLLSLDESPDGANCVQFSPDQQLLLAGSRGTAKVWDAKSGKLMLILEGHNAPVICAAFLPEGNRIITGSSDNVVKIWDSDSAKVIFTHSMGQRQLKYDDRILSMVLSPDGKQLVSAGHFGLDTGFVILTDPLTGKEIFTLKIPSYWTNQVAFSPDGKRLAMGSGPTAKILDISSRNVIMSLEDHTSSVTSVAFSPDGKTLATGTLDGIAKIWDTTSGKALLTFKSGTSSINSIVYLPDGKKFVSGHADGTADIWNFTLEGWKKGAGKDLFLAGLSFYQLNELNLSTLLSIHPNNESLLLATRETWQIAAFADLYAYKIAETGLPNKEDYERALRLYQACLSHDVDNDYFQQKIDALNALWIEKTDKK